MCWKMPVSTSRSMSISRLTRIKYQGLIKHKAVSEELGLQLRRQTLLAPREVVAWSA
jgi:hypothetical protein